MKISWCVAFAINIFSFWSVTLHECLKSKREAELYRGIILGGGVIFDLTCKEYVSNMKAIIVSRKYICLSIFANRLLVNE